MKLVHARDVIKSVRDRWLNQYARASPDSIVGLGVQRTVGEKRAALALLDLDVCSREDVDAAIGVSGWADNKCDECAKHAETIVRFGEEPDYEARWQDLCFDCMKDGMALLMSCEGVPTGTVLVRSVPKA